MSAAAQARYAERRKAADPAGWSAENVARNARFRARHPEKKAAWNAVYKALKNGQLTRPDSCQHCGVACLPEASHNDYAHRLEVEWLCRPCHTVKDVQLRKEN